MAHWVDLWNQDEQYSEDRFASAQDPRCYTCGRKITPDNQSMGGFCERCAETADEPEDVWEESVKTACPVCQSRRSVEYEPERTVGDGVRCSRCDGWGVILVER